MRMESPSGVVIGSGNATARESLFTVMLRLNSVIWLAGLVATFLITIPIALHYEKSSSLTVLDGRLALDFERFITERHPYSRPSLNGWAALDLALFRSGKPGVIVGYDDWLFTAEEFPLPSVRERLLAQNLDRVRTTIQALRRAGIETVVLPVPAKAEIYRDKVPLKLRDRVLPLSAVTGYLDRHGLPWIPVEPALLKARAQGETVFFRTETHWTPEGARASAQAVAAWLQAEHRQTWKADRAFAIQPGKPAVLESDLENFIPVRPLFGGLLPPAETYTPYRVISTELRNDADALFSDTANPVALVGTSYSADERWNFPGWLRAGLHTDIDNVSEKGKGPFIPMERFLQMVRSGRTGAKLVIWEMPVRALAMEYTAPHGK